MLFIYPIPERFPGAESPWEHSQKHLIGGGTVAGLCCQFMSLCNNAENEVPSSGRERFIETHNLNNNATFSKYE